MVARPGLGVDVWTEVAGTRHVPVQTSQVMAVYGDERCLPVVTLACGWHELFRNTEMNPKFNLFGCMVKAPPDSININNIGDLQLESLYRVCGASTPVSPTQPLMNTTGAIGMRASAIQVGIRRIVNASITYEYREAFGQVTYNPKGKDRGFQSMATRLAFGCAAVGDSSIVDPGVVRLLVDNADIVGQHLVRSVYRSPSLRKEDDSDEEVLQAFITDLSPHGWSVCSRY